MNIDQVLDFFDDLEMFGIKLGLEQTNELFDLVGDPRPKLRFVHIAGTNGKGSVGVMLAAAMRAAGLKAGFYSSPHLISPRERFRIDGAAVDEATLTANVAKLATGARTMRDRGRCPTYFEATTVLAGMIFAEAEVDVVIWETGMGGRLDATNAVTPICSVITGVALDHQAHLGDDLERIANEKAGIAKKGVPVFAGRLPPMAERVVRRRCAEMGSPLTLLPSESNVSDRSTELCRDVFTQRFTLNDRSITLSMGSRAQTENAELAMLTLDWLAETLKFNPAQAVKGFADIRWPARFQSLRNGRWLLDGAHNPQGTAALVDFVRETFPDKRFPVLFAHFADKNARECLAILSAIAERFVFVPIRGNKRRASSTPEELAALLDPELGLRHEIHRAAADALRAENHSDLLITGSLFLAGETLRWLGSEPNTVLTKYLKPIYSCIR